MIDLIGTITAWDITTGWKIDPDRPMDSSKTCTVTITCEIDDQDAAQWLTKPLHELAKAPVVGIRIWDDEEPAP